MVSHRACSEAELENAARELSLWAVAGQCLLLTGDLGAGKSTFARAYIRALAGERHDFDIPSPSFSLVQTYDNTRVPVAHIDLYRLDRAADVADLGLGDLVPDHVLLIEWPDRLPSGFATDPLHIHIAGTGLKRDIRVEASGRSAQRLARDADIKSFLARAGRSNEQRRFLEGDASSRRYETIGEGQSAAILMDMPRRPDGPVVKDGKPYSAIAHLAEDIRAVVAINDYLVAAGYSAPRIFDADLDAGLALIEPLGQSVYGKMRLAGDDMREPMKAAVEVLADMAGRSWPAQVAVREAGQHSLMPYDPSAMLIEVDLLPSWYWPWARQQPCSDGARATFETIWKALLPLVQPAVPVWVLRDFHSPNLLWLPERDGLRRVGLIDTQDCVLGHPAYDLVSLLQDARVDIGADEAEGLLQHYLAQRGRKAEFDAASFLRAFAILGAQRATKIMGIFARLNLRDGKPQYLKHIPRVSTYLVRNLQHPALAPLKDWYMRHLDLGEGAP
jgi:tRNA threonylcarbamoyl adenosine modification protein YjeE